MWAGTIMDMVEFLGLFKPMHLRNLITLLQESGQTIYTNAHNYQIMVTKPVKVNRWGWVGMHAF